MGKENILRDEIISVGRHLYERGLTVAKSGNLSARLDDATILITTSGSFLGNLSDDDITRVNLATGEPLDGKKPSSELPLHSLV